MRRAGWGGLERWVVAICVMGALSVALPAVEDAGSAPRPSFAGQHHGPPFSARKKRERPPRPRAPKQPIRLPA